MSAFRNPLVSIHSKYLPRASSALGKTLTNRHSSVVLKMTSQVKSPSAELLHQHEVFTFLTGVVSSMESVNRS